MLCSPLALLAFIVIALRQDRFVPNCKYRKLLSHYQYFTVIISEYFLIIKAGTYQNAPAFIM